jgi:hypothetical protein
VVLAAGLRADADWDVFPGPWMVLRDALEWTDMRSGKI